MQFTKILFSQKNFKFIESRNRIIFPHKFIDTIKKRDLRKREDTPKNVGKRKGKLLIECLRNDFNHYQFDKYEKFDPMNHLVSFGWKHRRRNGDHFVIHSTTNDIKPFEGHFSSLDIGEELTELIDRQFSIKYPSTIQNSAIPIITNRNNCLICGETGGGKTLAYLLPVIQQMLHCHQTNIPKCLIGVPTRELVTQITKLSQFLLKETNLVKTEGKFQSPITVGTIDQLCRYISNEEIDVERLRWLILDEVDTLLDDSFAHSSNELFNILRNKMDLRFESDLQFIFCGATIPRDLENILQDILPYNELQRVYTDQVNRLLPNVRHEFYRLGSSKKSDFLLKFLKENNNRTILIFANETRTVSWCKKFLEENEIENVEMISTRLSKKKRKNVSEKLVKGKNKNQIICTTDLLSRGIDYDNVDTIINFDCPKYISDYIHRSGRLGRLNSKTKLINKVVTLVSHPWEGEIIMNIESAARFGEGFSNVNANIKRHLNKRTK
ncbi:hypothetical protein SNEBB_004176 [Seison nebaliae]|nr:hypothetical protein SNEBB_004176 [Seison nebaliae]